jgi:hypothetical protein
VGTLFLAERERQLALSLSAFSQRRQRQRERELVLDLRDRGRGPPQGSRRLPQADSAKLHLAKLPQADSRTQPQSDSKMLLQADSSCFKFPEVIFEGEPQDGIAAYVELLDPTCNVMLFVCLSGGWASFGRRAALSLCLIETTLFLSKRER